MSVFQPVSIDWHVRDKDDPGILKVYLFQKNPVQKPIVTWKTALVEKLNQYNRSQYANQKFFTQNADGSTMSQYQDQKYTLGLWTSRANYAHFDALHEKYKYIAGRFCGDEMNPGYINTSIAENHICMYVTDSSTGEERLHSIVMFYFKSQTVIYIDIFCTSTVPGYVNFRGGYRLMSLLYGICRLLGVHIELHSLNAAIEFYKKWGYTETHDSTKSLPKFTSTCDPRNSMSFKDVAKQVVDKTRVLSGIKGFAGTLEQEEAFANAKIKEAEDIKKNVFHTINILDRVDSGLTEAEAEAEADVKVEVEIVYHKINNLYWKVSNKVFDDNGNVISYNLYDDDEDNMKMIFCVPAQNVETQYAEKQRDAREEVNKSFKNRPTGKHLLNRDMEWLKAKKRKPKQKWTKEDENKMNSNGLFNFLPGGSSRKQPRKTKTKKKRRNSKKIYKAKNLI